MWGSFGRVIALGALIAIGGVSTAGAAGKYDGTYTGTATLQPGASNGACRTHSTSITVTNDRLTYVYGANVAIVTLDIAADGSFSGSGLSQMVGRGRAPTPQELSGKVIGNRIEADTASPYCKFHLTLSKAG